MSDRDAAAPKTGQSGQSATGALIADQELSARLQQRVALVEERLRDAVANADALADSTSRHLVDAGGKRLRPLLTLLTAELGDAARPEVIDAAAVVELTHLATLYHDDVMDSAPLRRGAPAAHEVWGNSVAILTGDLLFARASVTVAGLGPDAVRQQAQTFERLCLGQLHETVGAGPDDDPIEHYLQVLSDKTGSLLATAARFGAQFAGCAREVVETVGRYGELIGIAFQLADDVIDLSESGQSTGKTPGTDLREHVVTLPVLLLRDLVADPQRRSDDDVDLLAAIEGDLSDDEALAGVVARLRAHAVLGQTQDLAKDYVRRAIGELEALPHGGVRAALEEFGSALVDRAS
ncbi:heptaprenyl diphosphate synthase [Micrococcales bacterium KH10]|nr:heptaprenyl diphosphate synthase [Micrococcales bacterium KH10]